MNSNIADTLRERTQVDFWWLNNGVTILASGATIVGKSLSLENVLIVNDLQTTETIYRVLGEQPRTEDKCAVLIKIIISEDDEVRARIIKATNYQNAVELPAIDALVESNFEFAEPSPEDSTNAPLTDIEKRRRAQALRLADPDDTTDAENAE